VKVADKNVIYATKGFFCSSQLHLRTFPTIYQKIPPKHLQHLGGWKSFSSW